MTCGPSPSPQRFAALVSRFRRETRGVAAVEFAMLAIPFFLILFSIVEVALVFLAELTLDKAAAEVGRQVRTGQLHSGHMSKADFGTLVCGEVKVMLDCGKVQFDLRSYASFADVPKLVPTKGDDVDTTGFGYDSGAASTVVALRIYYKWPIITNMLRPYYASTGDGADILVGSAVFRTEPY